MRNQIKSRLGTGIPWAADKNIQLENITAKSKNQEER